MERWARMCRSMGALGMAVAKVGHSQHLRPAAFLFSIPTAQNHGGGLFMKSAAIGLWNRIYFKRFGNGVGPEAGTVTEGGPRQMDRQCRAQGSLWLPRAPPVLTGAEWGAGHSRTSLFPFFVKITPASPAHLPSLKTWLGSVGIRTSA